MYVVLLNISQFRHPYLDKITFVIVLFRLPYSVTVIYASWAYTSCRIPVSIVRVHIVIYKHLFEVMGTDTPVLLEIESKVSSHDHSSPIADESCSFQLSHEGVHDGHASHPILPATDQILILVPRTTLAL